VDKQGTGQEKTQENRQGCKQSPEQMVEVNRVRLFPLTAQLLRLACVLPVLGGSHELKILGLRHDESYVEQSDKRQATHS
jgi:hypothetical protein